MQPLEPPWILFADKGKPLAILPAGRAGEVASVKGLSMKAAQAIVDAANIGRTQEDALRRLDEMIGKLHLIEALDLLARAPTGTVGLDGRRKWKADVESVIARAGSSQAADMQKSESIR